MNEDDLTMRPSDLSKLLNIMIKARLPLLIKGQPGVGKTDLVNQACIDTGSVNITMHPVVSDPTDFKGLPAVVDGQAAFMPYGELNALINAKQSTVCFLDDLGQSPPAVQAAAMQLLLARKINDKYVSEHVTFIAATNRKQDKASVSGILEPVKSRFATIVELEAHVEDWTTWALKNNLPHEIISFIRWRPEFLCDFKPTANITNSPSPRTIHACAKMIQAGILNTGLEMTAFAGAIGSGPAAELVGFIRTYRNLPDPVAILMDPHNAKVPPDNDPGAMYAVCGALAARATADNFERICVYSERIPPDFSVLMIRDCLRRDKTGEIANTSALIRWADIHKDIIL